MVCVRTRASEASPVAYVRIRSDVSVETYTYDFRKIFARFSDFAIFSQDFRNLFADFARFSQDFRKIFIRFSQDFRKIFGGQKRPKFFPQPPGRLLAIVRRHGPGRTRTARAIRVRPTHTRLKKSLFFGREAPKKNA